MSLCYAINSEAGLYSCRPCSQITTASHVVERDDWQVNSEYTKSADGWCTFCNSRLNGERFRRHTKMRQLRDVMCEHVNNLKCCIKPLDMSPTYSCYPPLMCGVPQGSVTQSVLGPILFIMYSLQTWSQWLKAMACHHTYMPTTRWCMAPAVLLQSTPSRRRSPTVTDINWQSLVDLAVVPLLRPPKKFLIDRLNVCLTPPIPEVSEPADHRNATSVAQDLYRHLYCHCITDPVAFIEQRHIVTIDRLHASEFASVSRR